FARTYVGRVGLRAGVTRRIEVLRIGTRLAPLRARFEPRAHLRSERLFFGRLLKIHAYWSRSLRAAKLRPRPLAAPASSRRASGAPLTASYFIPSSAFMCPRW